MQALILAAGMGKRLKELTRDNTKCMVQVNGVTLIDRLLHQLEKLRLTKIIIVVGYQGQRLMGHVAALGLHTPIQYIENPLYDKTNNIYSLALAKDELCREDTLLLESDIIFEDAVVQALVADPRPTLALVDRYEPWMDGTCIKLNEDDSIAEFVPGSKFKFSEADEYYKTVNLYKFSRAFSQTCYVPFLNAYAKALGNNEYYEQVLRVIAMLDDPEIRAKRLDGQLWYEIDDEQDLDIAASLFARTEERAAGISSRYGGYWRYPKLLDFCYPVNPYFPPQKLMDEMRYSFACLLTQYPSGMAVNSLLAAKSYALHADSVVVGNGSAELIKVLVELLPGRIGFVRPTFEEYPSRCRKENAVFYRAAEPDFRYTADDLMDFFGGKGISTLVVINPDNPSGNYIPKTDVLRLVAWAREKGITLVLDESFADFAEEENSTLLEQPLLAANPHLFVMKSISKSHGVPGVRLGILASGNTQAIAAIKKQAAIWNINSFGEFYLQISEKYKKDYVVALARIRAERTRFCAALAQVPGLRVIPSQANYAMAELTGGITAKTLACRLLADNKILIKDLSGKLGGKPYVRLAVRSAADNDRLIAALKKLLG